MTAITVAIATPPTSSHAAVESKLRRASLSTAISTAEWTFTDCLIAGLEGHLAGDGDGDGELRLSELAAWTERRMAAIDGQLSSFVTTNGFKPEFVLGPAVRRDHPSVGEVMLARDEG